MTAVLFRWRSYSLYWYSALIWLGIVLAIAYAQWQGRRRGYRHPQVLDAALWVLVGGLVGARLAYVLPNWQDYGGRVTALLGLWGGGYAFQGGLFGGTVALWLYSLRARLLLRSAFPVLRPSLLEGSAGLSFPRLADLAAPAVALAQALGWAGAWVHGANYGLVMRSPFSMWLPDLYGVYGPRFPTQMLACALGIFLFLGLHRLSRLHLPHRTRAVPPRQAAAVGLNEDGVPTPAGRLALLYLLGNGLGHFLLEFTRADDAPYWGLVRWTQVAALAEAALAIALLLYLRYRPGKKAEEVAG